jgi:hypothetical protein
MSFHQILISETTTEMEREIGKAVFHGDPELQ